MGGPKIGELAKTTGASGARLVGRVLRRAGVPFTGVLAVLLGIVAWETLGPDKPEVSDARRELAAPIIEEVVRDLRDCRADLRSVVILHFANDPTDFLTDGVRAAVIESGILEVADQPAGEKLRKALDLRADVIAEVEPAVEVAREAGVDGVVVGVVDRFEFLEGRGDLVLDVQMADAPEAQPGRVIFSKRYERRVGGEEPAPAEEPAVAATPVPADGPSTWAPLVSIVKRVAVWALLVFVVPLLSVNFMVTMLRKQSNAANATALGVYTGVGLLAAWFLIGGAFTAGWAIGVSVALAGAGALAYNVWIMTQFQEREEV